MSNKNSDGKEPIIPIPQPVQTPRSVPLRESTKSYSDPKEGKVNNRMTVVDTAGGSTISKGNDATALTGTPKSED